MVQEPAARSPRRNWTLPVLFVVLLIASAAYLVPRLSESKRIASLKTLSTPELEARVSAHPEDNEARYRLGLAYARENRSDDAIRELMAVVEKDPTRADAFNDLGVVFLLLARYTEAQTAFKGALDVKPDFAAPHANLGRLHIAVRMAFTAVKDFEKAAKLDPKNLDTLNDLGEAHLQTLNHNAGLEAYNKALAVDPKNVQAMVGTGRALYALARYDEAEKVLAKSIEMAPNDSQALVSIARLRMERSTSKEDLPALKALFERAAKADPENPDAVYDLGRIAVKMSRHSDAVERFKQTLRMASNHGGAMHQLERSLRKVGRTVDADKVAKIIEVRLARDREITRLEEVLRRSTKNAAPKARLAALYFEAGKPGDAQLMIRQIQASDPKHPSLPALYQAAARARVR